MMNPIPLCVPGFLIAGNGQPMNLAVTMLIMFGSAKLLAELFERLRLPGVAGEIPAGTLIGPSVLGWISWWWLKWVWSWRPSRRRLTA